ncbi:hypothetical protein BS17DRAFT_772609 [Gyrodon lividus]|nr:hypothetical protein BS17DRAFT_772609 [Gyrodon lividus]
MGEISKHERFYMTTVIFLVEDCLFKVPRDPFETESTVFRDMFSLPVVEDHTEVEGLDDSKPIRLEGTKKDDFEQLMKVLLHRINGQFQELPGDIAQWTSVLKLSTLWGFSTLRQVAIDNLSELETRLAEKIALGYAYDVKSWLLPVMNELVRQPEPIDMKEASCMGIETALKLASVREQLALHDVPCKINCQNFNAGTVYRKTHTYFTKELAPGRRANVRALDFTPILRNTLKIYG